ncbi:hypothetical protein PG987_006772 [Apiospora arundinis]
MSALPEGWEWDYDGTRWFYRYKASGLIQYHFPKPGDEFPEYVGYGVDSFDLEPEERLASDMQMKRRDTQGGTQPGAVPTSSQRRKKPVDEIDEIGATGYFDPEGFMFLGPGGYADTDASSEQETENRPSEMENTSVDKQTSSITTQVDRELHGTTHGTGSVVGGNGIAAQTGGEGPPLVSQSSGQLNEAPGSDSTTPTCLPQAQFFAELASHETRQCADELAPIELDASQSFPGVVLAELSSESPSVLPKDKGQTRANTSNNLSSSAAVQPTGAYPLVSASFAFPPLAKDHAPSRSEPENARHNSAASAPENTNFQAWQPEARANADGSMQSKRVSMMPSGSSLLEFQNPHRVSTMPNQLPSQSHVASPTTTGFGPGFVVFHAITPGKDPPGKRYYSGGPSAMTSRLKPHLKMKIRLSRQLMDNLKTRAIAALLRQLNPNPLHPRMLMKHL